MDKDKLQELIYDLEREPDTEKAHGLIEKYIDESRMTGDPGGVSNIPSGVTTTQPPVGKPAYGQINPNGNPKNNPTSGQTGIGKGNISNNNPVAKNTTPYSDPKPVGGLDKQLADLHGVCNIQCDHGNWNYDSYMHGMANGLILADAIMSDIEPEFLSTPEDGFLNDKDTKPVEGEQCNCGPNEGCNKCPDEADWKRKMEETCKQLQLLEDVSGEDNEITSPNVIELIRRQMQFLEDVSDEREKTKDKCTCTCSECPGEGKITHKNNNNELCDCDISDGSHLCSFWEDNSIECTCDSGCTDEIIKRSGERIVYHKNNNDELCDCDISDDGGHSCSFWREEDSCTCESDNGCDIHGPFDDNPIADARKVLRDAFAQDPGFKLGYMANMRMFINDHANALIDEDVIYDMIDYIFKR